MDHLVGSVSIMVRVWRVNSECGRALAVARLLRQGPVRRLRSLGRRARAADVLEFDLDQA